MAQFELDIIVFKAASGARLYFDNLQALQNEGLTILDAALLSKDSLGKVSIDETQDLDAGQGSLFGAVSGALVGFLGGPLGALFGMAAGAAIGGTAAESMDTGVPDAAVNVIRDKLSPGSSALLLVVEREWGSRLKALIPEEDTDFLQIALTDEATEKLKTKPKRKSDE